MKLSRGYQLIKKIMLIVITLYCGLLHKTHVAYKYLKSKGLMRRNVIVLLNIALRYVSLPCQRVVWNLEQHSKNIDM